MFPAAILIHYGRKQDLSRLHLEFTTRLLRKLTIEGLKKTSEKKEGNRERERKREMSREGRRR